ncbi:hypothetical protein P0136_03055 [Lentisphaerota bacterium ZTH]|nr:hypothetical protein JYG24_05805 [Lentisphaerota bacterium]WET06981.1 hypothetical protein P0136_03055 [Lentisphaerota bacterium ZTH]
MELLDFQFISMHSFISERNIMLVNKLHTIWDLIKILAVIATELTAVEWIFYLILSSKLFNESQLLFNGTTNTILFSGPVACLGFLIIKIRKKRIIVRGNS